ncbi:Ribonuclease E [Sphingomonas aurantiaca]|uniref:Ribonuclease E n=1 Tax=Sphingomonas aurantiaca TaxID=185949 RepID=A0A5E7ZHZ1_9SPHN|nr:ribonuclease E/G [Sphingomonas aurantiaca]VVT18743.1 Ribonuclease E [Sphingomonas aurantiaca]
MTTRMLIDARHREETRIAVVKGNRIEEFDFESAERKQLKGNIYLAKVTRVEPSLQAAFIDYGGNRHGFLAFSEIHPDYYQIPKEDRDALLREEAEHAAEEAALRADYDADDEEGDDEDDIERFEDDGGVDPDVAEELEGGETGDAPRRKRKSSSDDAAVEDLRERRMNLRRRYKIQDVIHRRQVLLVQVVKEERGNKGAALTTYLSLAGRYCVLMPNTSHGGGISRKISNAGDRKRLKSIMADMQLPPSMGCIVRTAGLQRSKVEIKRDFDYLARLWDGIREATLQASAPALVYGDSDLIKRAIRDIYNKEIEEVIVEGEDGYRQAREFMRLLMPTHARRIKHYADPVPLFQRAGVEDQLSAMYHPVVQLKSGGYLVINPTEALVSIDINSGRSTREHSIEQTATATNLEAAQEIGRQLRLRDMAGLVVIDFIDMDNNSNVRKVEKAMKEALKNDRARIQIGRISSFGLMEMSRQRLRTGVLEASTRACPHCEGTGLVRTASSSGISALRLIEDEAARGRGSLLTLRASQEAAVYILNRKRADIAEIEDRYGVIVEIIPGQDEEGAHMTVEASGPPPAHAPKFVQIIEEDEDDLPEEIEDEIEEDEVEEAEAEQPRRREPREQNAPRENGRENGRDADGEGGKKRRRRRGRRGRARPGEEGAVEGTNGEGSFDEADTNVEEIDAVEGDIVEVGGGEEAETIMSAEQANGAEGEGRRRRGRRGRRGGRRNEQGSDNGQSVAVSSIDDAQLIAEAPEPEAYEPVESTYAEPPYEPAQEPVVQEAPVAEVADGPKMRRRPRARAAAAAANIAEPVAEAAPKARRGRKPRAVEAEVETVAPEPVAPEPVAAEPAAPKPSRRRREAVAEATMDEVSATPAETIEASAPKPKRARRKASDAVAETPVVEEAPAKATKPRGRPRKAAVVDAGDAAPTSEPLDTPIDTVPPKAEVQPQDVATDRTDDGTNDGPDGAPRRGWWQRTFG